MYIGILNAPNSGVAFTLTTTRAGGRIALPSEADDRLFWSWPKTVLSPVELHYEFAREVFLSLVRLPLRSGSAVTAAEIFSEENGALRCIGAQRAPEGSTITGTVEITAARHVKRIVIRLTPALRALDLDEVQLVGAPFDEPVLYPTPASLTWKGGALPLSALACAASDGHADSDFALGYLRERLAEQWGIHAADGASAVQIAHDDSIAADGYRLSITADSVNMSASTRLGLLYAAERIIELIGESGLDGAIPACEIDDAPYKEMRGFHFGMPSRENMPYMKRLIKTILIPYHYNQLIIEFAGCMRYDSHPEIGEAWLDGNRRARAGEIPTFPHGTQDADGELLEKDEVRDFCDYARELGFELIPEVQSMGHVQYITLAHPDIAETDESVTEKKLDTRDADQPPSTFYKHSYCPQNEKSYKIIFDLIDEIVDVVRPPRFVHMGHDEIYQIGLCPKCKGIPHDVLYEKHVTAMHDYLAKKGLRMMIWADMLQPTEKKYKTFPAVTRLPRDIVLLDFIWYFHFDLDMEDNLLPYGYKVMMGNLYSSHYPRYETRAAKENMIGGQVSTWCLTNDYTLAKKGKQYDLLYTAEMLWSPAYTADAREVYARILAARIPELRRRTRGEAPAAYAWKSVPLGAPSPAVPAALRTFCPGTLLPAGESVTIPVNAAAKALRIAHTALWPERRVAWQPLYSAGTYTIRYADGAEESIPVEYAGNLRCYKERWGAPLPEQYYRHQGYIATWAVDPVLQEKAENGSDVTVLALTWTNPHPEKEIREIVCTEDPASAAGLAICGVEIAE